MLDSKNSSVGSDMQPNLKFSNSDQSIYSISGIEIYNSIKFSFLIFLKGALSIPGFWFSVSLDPRFLDPHFSIQISPRFTFFLQLSFLDFPLLDLDSVSQSRFPFPFAYPRSHSSFPPNYLNSNPLVGPKLRYTTKLTKLQFFQSNQLDASLPHPNRVVHNSMGYYFPGTCYLITISLISFPFPYPHSRFSIPVSLSPFPGEMPTPEESAREIQIYNQTPPSPLSVNSTN
ncbi:hypothetical protein OCU04_012243 [Sclerotinia nivalis]|uniref:Uncharacterized protein n=1 Tax=Sclerotinia nivalis TaxID=352851 RepID=A0A9X0AEA4_9HELO|nr:hypothetical protein OCU04_012243 [Sclerotinia nivalis]